MTKLLNITGIVVKKIDYKSSSRLIHVFTKEEGLLTLSISGISAKNTKHLALSSPLTIANFQVKNTHSRYRVTDGTPLIHFDKLRSNFKAVSAAFEILKALDKTQMPENPAPKLFELTTFCLAKLESQENPEPLLALFLLKMLQHEGLLPLPSSFFSPSSKPHFTDEERVLIDQFSQERFIKDIDLTHFSSTFLDKVRQAFALLHQG